MKKILFVFVSSLLFVQFSAFAQIDAHVLRQSVNGVDYSKEKFGLKGAIASVPSLCENWAKPYFKQWDSFKQSHEGVTDADAKFDYQVAYATKTFSEKQNCFNIYHSRPGAETEVTYACKVPATCGIDIYTSKKIRIKSKDFFFKHGFDCAMAFRDSGQGKGSINCMMQTPGMQSCQVTCYYWAMADEQDE